jgi:uncharacterized Tic20 family protein
MDDQDRIPDLDAMDVTPQPPEEPPAEGEGVPIPSRIRDAVSNVRQRIQDDLNRDRDVVREYEERYYRVDSANRLETPSARVDGPSAQVRVPRKVKHHFNLANIDDNERKWAALAHGSTLLTALVGLGSGGLGVVITMLVPLAIYFSFRKRSEFVAFHALQAFTIQLIGTIGWLVFLIVGLVVWAALFFISLVLIIVLVGIILAPLVFLLLPLLVLASFALPLGMVIYGVIATVETWSGRNYRIPYIARWVESQMYD